MYKRWRLPVVALFCALFFVAIPLEAQYLNFTATKLQDVSGAKLASGEFCATLKNESGQTGNILLPGGGQATNTPICRDVTDGVIMPTYQGATLGALILADFALTQPTMQCYKIVVTNNADGSVVLGSFGSFKSAYDCVQPYTGAYWCTSPTCNFDNYIPPGVPGVAYVAGLPGPTGPAGAPGANGAQGNPGGSLSYPGVTSAGAGTLAVGPALLGATYTCPGYVYANLNACLDAAKAYASTRTDGTAHAVKIELQDGVLPLTSPYTLVSGMQLEGVTPRQTNSTVPDESGRVPNGGTWINCGGAASCFIGNNLNAVKIKDMGFLNWTGAAVSFGASGQPGLTFSELASLYCIGNATVNTSDKCIELYNMIQAPIHTVYAWNVNTILRMVGQLTGYNSGNSVISDIIVETYPKSAATGNNTKAGISIESLVGSGDMNLLTLIRPQVNTGGGDSTAPGILLSSVLGIGIYDADIEGQAGVAVKVVNSSQNHIDLMLAPEVIPVSFDATSSDNKVTGQQFNANGVTDARDAALSRNTVIGAYSVGALHHNGSMTIHPLNSTSADSLQVWSFSSPGMPVEFISHSGVSRISAYEAADGSLEWDAQDASAARQWALPTNGTAPLFKALAGTGTQCVLASNIGQLSVSSGGWCSLYPVFGSMNVGTGSGLSGVISINSDTGLSRTGPGAFALGNGTLSNTSGVLSLTHLSLMNGASAYSYFNSTASTGRNVYFPDGDSGTVLTAILTTTAASSDVVTVTGMTSTGHCSLTATNAGAATNIATTYVSAKAANQITVTHTATAAMTYDVLCSAR